MYLSDFINNLFWFCVGVFISLMLFVTISEVMYDVTISHNTAQDICKALTGENITFNAHSENGKLICERPTYDNTQNIIVKDNAGEETK